MSDGNQDSISFEKQLGNRIKDIIEQKDLSLKEFGYRADLEKQNVNRLLSGKTNPTLRTLRRIASALEMPLSKLLDGLTE